MLSEFEKAVAYGSESLDTIRQMLLRRADDDRHKKIAQIEHDYKVCQLIKYGLDQPRESPAFGVSRGVVRWLQKKHPRDDTLCRELKKSVWMEDHEETERMAKHSDRGKRKQEKTTSQTDNGTVREGESSTTTVYEPIPEETPGKG